ncbi:hypothetical protein Pint_17764 [Pistacia integerrima]|uniref:Uncharacterized protein n=1 Tax=Pistacia integerrima TaxID=434235 RepID=A0ACC0YZB9_9ROSI|nr:hypothetical protein Pint_17764 [Pistacia integerrima]
MKHFMQPRNTILRETHSSESPSSSSPNPNSKLKSSQKQKSYKENAPPSDLNPPLPPSPTSSKIKSPLPPRPPNPLKRKLATDTLPENVMVGVPNSGVQVIVRLRPVNKEEEQGEMIVQKVGNDALKINGQTFTFDSVADIDSTQLDVFQLVGIALIENCLAGFNSSVFAYRQCDEVYLRQGRPPHQLSPRWGSCNNSCNGPEFVLQLNFSLKLGCSTAKSPGSNCSSFVMIFNGISIVNKMQSLGGESIEIIIEKLHSKGCRVPENYEIFSRVAICRLGRLLPDARWTDLAHQNPFTIAVKNFGVITCKEDKVARVHQVLKRKGLTGKRGQRVKALPFSAKDGEVPPREIVADVRPANAVSSSPSKKLDQKHIPQSSCKSCERHVVVKGSSKVGNWRLLSCKQSPKFCVSYKLDKIQPRYEATLVISPQDELPLVSIPCQVILGSLKHVTIQSPNFGNSLLPGSMVKHLKFEINEAN